MRFGTLSAALLLATPLAAQQPPDSARADSLRAPSFRIQGVTVDIPRPMATAGGASAVEFRLDSLSPRPAPTIDEVLRAMPLVQIRRNSRGEAQPALRGAEDRQIAVLVDGVPLTLGWDARTDLSIIPLTAARRIRLVRGLSTILHGPNVLGGAVEVDVARGAEDFAPPDPVTLHLGMDHTGAASVAATGGRLLETDGGRWELRGGAGFQDQNGFPLPDGLGPEQRERFLTRDGDLRLNSDSRRIDGFASARYRSDGGRWLSAAASGFQVERGVPPEAHIEDPRLWRYPHQRRFVLALSGGTGFQDTALGNGDLEASVGIDVGRTELEAFATEAYDAVVETEDGDDRTLTFRTSGDLRVTPRTDLRAAATFADVFHREVLDGAESSDYRQRLWSLGIEGERRLDGLAGIPGLGTTRLTVGVAADGSDTPESGDKPPLDRLWDWGARVGVSTLAADGAVSFHGSLSRRTRFPALRELYSGALGRFEPNPELRPEKLTGGELGVTMADERAELQVVGFHQRLSDGIVRATVQTSEGPKFKRVNQDEVRSTGLEVLAAGTVGALALNGDLTLQRVRGRDEDGREVRLEYEPALAGKVGLESPLPLAMLGSADVRWVGRQQCQNPEAGGLESFDSDPRLDVGVRRRFDLRRGGPLGRLEARVSVDNVGDAAVFGQCGLPEPGRVLSVQVRLW
jgi:iron complex outermembrane receptor protein